jgi:hypothetical protein
VVGTAVAGKESVGGGSADNARRYQKSKMIIKTRGRERHRVRCCVSSGKPSSSSSALVDQVIVV